MCIYMYTLSLWTMISRFNNPPGPEIIQKLFSFLFDISSTKM